MSTPLRVLIVEDRPADAELMVYELRHAGFEPEWKRVETEQDYLAALTTRPDIILADHTLPEFNAPRALDLLRERGLDTPLIVITGSISEEVAVERIKQGAADYLLKDRMARLGSAVKHALEQKRLRDEKRQAEEETKRNAERIRALHEIDTAITSSLDIRRVLDILLEKIDLSLPYSAATIRLWNKESRLLEPIACRNLDEREWKATEWKGGRGSANIVFETKAALAIGSCQTDSRIRDPEFFRKHSLVSYLGIPLIAHDETLGVISFYTKQKHEFTNDEIEFLNALAGQAAIAIHNAQLYDEMTKLAADLSRSNKVKDEFLSIMSHELRTPLNVVMGYTGMIKDGMLGEINPKQEEALERVIRRANDQLALVNNILFATVMETGKVNIDIHEVSLGDLLGQLKLTYEAPINKELSLNWDYASDLPVIRTDSAKVKQILQNLIDNALKFTAKGSVTVSAGIRREATGGRQPFDRLRVGLSAVEGQQEEVSTQASSLSPHAFVEFTVADTGVGIPKEHLSIIFEKFRQVDSSETRLFGGVGMGLYVAKRFAELLGGSVQVESEVGKGSMFTLKIPVE